MNRPGSACNIRLQTQLLLQAPKSLSPHDAHLSVPLPKSADHVFSNTGGTSPVLTNLAQIFRTGASKSIVEGLEQRIVTCRPLFCWAAMADYDSKTLPAENRSFAAKVSADLCGHMGLSHRRGGSCGPALLLRALRQWRSPVLQDPVVLLSPSGDGSPGIAFCV